jgi:hypothetical protein
VPPRQGKPFFFLAGLKQQNGSDRGHWRHIG